MVMVMWKVLWLKAFSATRLWIRLNPYSQFKDLETQTSLTAEELFNNVYRGDYHLTLQTCIENNGNSSWGRLFIVASPVENTVWTLIAIDERIKRK